VESGLAAERFYVILPTIYDVLKRTRLQKFIPRNSTNQRFKTLQYGLIFSIQPKVEVDGILP
jgi:hypothetical protein